MTFTLLRRFRADRSGGILILTGLSFLFLVAIAGSGYDLGRKLLVKQRMQQAGDAAALAGAGLPMGSTNDERIAVANSFFTLNYPDQYLGIARPTPSIAIVGTNLRVTSQSTVPTAFVRNFGISTIDAAALSVVQIKQRFNKIDLILAMDNSNSMRKTDVGSGGFLDGDIPSMVNACFTEMSSPAQLAYTLASYNFNYTAPTNYCAYPYNGVNWGFTGPTRVNALRYVADFAASTLLNPNPKNHQVAIVKWDNVLIGSRDFSPDYATVHGELMSMFAGMDTNSTVGMQKALDLAAGFRSDAVHAVILLTDGRNETIGHTSAADNQAYNDATIAICNTLKAMPHTLVYTIAFGSEVTTPTVRQFLSDCATGPNGSGTPNLNLTFYAAPDAAALSAAFTTILANLRRVQIIQ